MGYMQLQKTFARPYSNSIQSWSCMAAQLSNDAIHLPVVNLIQKHMSLARTISKNVKVFLDPGILLANLLPIEQKYWFQVFSHISIIAKYATDYLRPSVQGLALLLDVTRFVSYLFLCLYDWFICFLSIYFVLLSPSEHLYILFYL